MNSIVPSNIQKSIKISSKSQSFVKKQKLYDFPNNGIDYCTNGG